MSKEQKLEHFKTLYAYQAEVLANPTIQTWLARVQDALAKMSDVEVEFVTTLQERCADNKIYHDHDNHKVTAFLSPVLSSTEGEPMDEECLPYYRVRFADGIELLADDAELFSFDSRFHEFINAVSGAFACARELGYVGPWDLVAHGTEEDQAKFLEAFNSLPVEIPPGHWALNHNTPAKFRKAA